MDKILITGAAGFIGSTLCEQLLNEGKSIIGIDNFDPFYDVEIKVNNMTSFRHHNAFQFFEGDIRDYDFLMSLPEFNSIIHIAAKAGVRPSILNPRDYLDVNIGGTQNLLELCKLRGVNKFVFASSSSVYGVNENVPWEENDSGLMPISPYASSKLSCEMLGHVYTKLYDIQFLALRFFTVYGPKQRPDLAIHKFTSKILKGETIPVYGDGSTKRDYTFISDIIFGIKAALTYDKTKYEVINLGNNQLVSLSELIETLEDVLGKKAVIDRQDEKPGDVRITYANIEKAKTLLNYQPKVSLKEGLEAFKNWYLAKK